MLKPAVILIVMRKRLMCSSCILWPTLCSAIFLCQLPLSPPTLHILLKCTGSLDRDCETPGLLSPHMVRCAPRALLVKPSLTPIPHRGCGVALHMAAGWAAAMANLPPQPHGHAWGPAATSALTIDDGAEPAKHIHATGRQRHSAGQSSSSFLLLLSLTPSSLQPNGKLLGRGYPVIFSPSAEWAPKGVLGKLATWPADYSLSMRDDLVLKRGRRAAVWLRSKKCSLSPL